MKYSLHLKISNIYIQRREMPTRKGLGVTPRRTPPAEVASHSQAQGHPADAHAARGSRRPDRKQGKGWV